MPFFAYKARNARGELVEGTLESADSGGVADLLINTGVTPVDIRQTANPQAKTSDNWWKKLTEEKVKDIDVQLFSRQIYTLLKAGVPIMRGLAGLQESAVKKPSPASFRICANRWMPDANYLPPCIVTPRYFRHFI